jgi:hypothetical protein
MTTPERVELTLFLPVQIPRKGRIPGSSALDHNLHALRVMIDNPAQAKEG